jgi:hypothetical protein
MKLTDQNVGDLKPIEVKGGCVLVKKVIENNFTCLIKDGKQVNKAFVIGLKLFVALDQLHFLQLELIH